jgi:lactoylglutathione lyase
LGRLDGHIRERKMQGIKAFGHIALRVTDLQRSLDFWEKGLGFPEMTRLLNDKGDAWIVYLRVTDEFFLELFPGAEADTAPRPNTSGLHHLCLSIEDIDATTKRIEAAGIKLTSPISTGLDGNRGAWITDPDGHGVELMEMDPDCIQYQAIRRLRAEGR